MKRNLTKLNGILAMIFGLVAVFFPGITLAALGIYFAISILIGGISLLAGAAQMKRTNHHWYFLVPEGIIGVLIGIVILARPKLAATVFITIIGLWAVIIGLVLLFSYFRKVLPGFSNSFLLIVSILSLLAGVLILINPFESTRFITILIGIYALVYGLFSVVHTTKYNRKLN
jgi:uncharacterized membrane protein HdeD (DUF308 family)